MTGKKELRLALGMRGGVSLAIWIGGACAEIDRLRKANTDADIEFWPELLDESDYGAVIVDVIAGASAGGLNGVLYAASQQYGFDLDEVRGIWLDVGGLQTLIRSTTPDLSVLDGDAQFLDVLHTKLSGLIEAATAPERCPRVDVQLSATLVEPITRPAPHSADEPMREARFISRFHFAHEPRATWAASDLPTEPAERAAAIWRLALAGRATSSFPVAFEPAIVRSTRPDTFESPQPDNTPGRLVDMRGVFADARGAQDAGTNLRDADFVVADGGILDNIPLGKAISAIADATADSPTKRYLVYLHPTGPTEEKEAKPPPPVECRPLTRRSAVGVLRGALTSRVESENTVSDIAQMEEHNRGGRLAAAMRRATFSEIVDPSSRTTLVSCASEVFDRYELERALGDARSIEILLADPLATIGGDTFPRNVAGPTGDREVTDDRWRAPIAEWSPARREGLGSGLIDVFAARLGALDPNDDDRDNDDDNDADGDNDDDTSEGGVSGSDAGPPTPALEGIFTAGTGPLERVLRLMIEWARHLDRPDVVVPSGVSSPGVTRQTLYDVLAFVRREMAAPRRMAWVTAAATVADPDGWETPPIGAVDQLLLVTPSQAVSVCDELPDPDTHTARESYVETTRTRLHRLGLPDDPEATVDLRVAIVDRVLVPIAHGLARCELADDDTPSARLHTSLSDPQMVARLAGGGPAAQQVLGALEVLCYQEFLSGAPGAGIDFVRMSAANRTPLHRHFKKLQANEHDPTPLDAKRKLAGNELMNFGAFAKAEWRANDWMWGRLDAAATLVDLLITADSISRIIGEAPPSGDPDPGLAAIRSLASGPDDGPWNSHLETHVWSKLGGEVAAALEAHRLLPDDPEATAQLVSKVRDVVLARRQWQILSDELGKEPWRTDSGTGPLDPPATLQAVEEHDVGLDSFRKPRDGAHAKLFWGISKAAGKTAERTIHLTMHPDKAGESPGALAKAGGLTVTWGGRLATAVLLKPWVTAGATVAALAAAGFGISRL